MLTLMSNTGVSSIASRPHTVSVVPFTFNNSTSVTAIGVSRSGVLDANMPTFFESQPRLKFVVMGLDLFVYQIITRWLSSDNPRMNCSMEGNSSISEISSPVVPKLDLPRPLSFLTMPIGHIVIGAVLP